MYVAYQPPEAVHGGVALSPPSLMFLHPGRPGSEGNDDSLKKLDGENQSHNQTQLEFGLK